MWLLVFSISINAVLNERQLKLSLDAMQSDFSTVPRIKLIAALQVFRAMYVTAGVDDVLNPSVDLPIGPSAPEPHTFSGLHYGRDAVLGLELRFRDPDVSALLRLYGVLIASLLS